MTLTVGQIVLQALADAGITRIGDLRVSQLKGVVYWADIEPPARIDNAITRLHAHFVKAGRPAGITSSTDGDGKVTLRIEVAR